jgi:hypothetical protein
MWSAERKGERVGCRVPLLEAFLEGVHIQNKYNWLEVSLLEKSTAV